MSYESQDASKLRDLGTSSPRDRLVNKINHLSSRIRQWNKPESKNNIAFCSCIQTLRIESKDENLSPHMLGTASLTMTDGEVHPVPICRGMEKQIAGVST